MTIAKKLEKASGMLFFAGFFLSKLQYIPYPLVSAIFRFGSLGIYLLAYLCWLTASLLHPDHKEHYRKWYGFAQIKEQFLFSSFIGLVATVISIAAVFIPALLPPAAFLFLIGNVIWAVGEYHKLKNPPPNDENFSTTRQQSYVSYAVTTTSISLVAAIAATLIFCFPPFAIPITIFSLLICAGLGALAFEFWLNCNFGVHEPIKPEDSYDLMSDSLGPSVSPEPSNEPGCFSSLFASPAEEKPTNAIELETFKVKETQDENSLADFTPL